jgi:hypothetical protein
VKEVFTAAAAVGTGQAGGNQMKVILSVVLIVLIGAMGVPARAGRLQIYSDAALTDCTLSDAVSATVNIYVADYDWDGSTGARFRIAASNGFTGVWLGETSPFTTVGTSPTDFSVGYANCMVGKWLILKMTYQLFGSSACSTLSIAPAVGFPVQFCTYCSFGEYPCWGFDDLHVNCGGNCSPVATAPATWGKIKSLYRN